MSVWIIIYHQLEKMLIGQVGSVRLSALSRDAVVRRVGQNTVDTEVNPPRLAMDYSVRAAGCSWRAVLCRRRAALCD
jgi:hypothetical protein